MIKSKDIIGKVTVHWMDARLKANLPINDPTNMIRISAKDLLVLHTAKMGMLGITRSIHEESMISTGFVTEVA